MRLWDYSGSVWTTPKIWKIWLCLNNMLKVYVSSSWDYPEQKFKYRISPRSRLKKTFRNSRNSLKKPIRICTERKFHVPYSLFVFSKFVLELYVHLCWLFYCKRDEYVYKMEKAQVCTFIKRPYNNAPLKPQFIHSTQLKKPVLLLWEKAKDRTYVCEAFMMPTPNLARV